MSDLENYLQDGANYQARAVLMFLQGNSSIEESWCDKRKNYKETIKVARWENCREQGYVVSLLDKNRDQINIAFYEHRNSDSIHAIKWLQDDMNSLNIDNSKFGDIFKDKYDTSFSVDWGEVKDMADWIKSQLVKHYTKED